jgi:hypothetical protein
MQQFAINVWLSGWTFITMTAFLSQFITGLQTPDQREEDSVKSIFVMKGKITSYEPYKVWNILSI